MFTLQNMPRLDVKLLPVVQERVKSGAPCGEAKGGETENSRRRLNLTPGYLEGGKQNMNSSEAKPRGRSSAGCPPPLSRQGPFLRPHLADKPDPTQNLGSFARSCQQPPARQPRGDRTHLRGRRPPHPNYNAACLTSWNIMSSAT